MKDKMTDTGVRRLYHTPKGYEGTHIKIKKMYLFD